MKKHKLLFLSLVLLSVLPASSYAEIVTINLTAEISEIEDGGQIFTGLLNIGDLITGSYSYDSDTPDSNPAETVGQYWYSEPGYGITLTSEGFVFQTDPANVDFLLETGNNTNGTDNYLIRSYNNLPLSNGIPVDHIAFELIDNTATALSSDTLPLTAPDLGDWDLVEIWDINIFFNRNLHLLVKANVTSAELVPEPATLLLFGLGAVMLRKRK